MVIFKDLEKLDVELIVDEIYEGEKGEFIQWNPN